MISLCAEHLEVVKVHGGVVELACSKPLISAKCNFLFSSVCRKHSCRCVGDGTEDSFYGCGLSYKFVWKELKFGFWLLLGYPCFSFYTSGLRKCAFLF